MGGCVERWVRAFFQARKEGLLVEEKEGLRKWSRDVSLWGGFGCAWGGRWMGG